MAGLDVEPRLLAVAAQLSAQHGLAVETVLTDAASTGLPPGSFDLVHERMLLLNVTSPQDVVATLLYQDGRCPIRSTRGVRRFRCRHRPGHTAAGAEKEGADDD